MSHTTLSEITGTLLMRSGIVVVDTDAAKRKASGRPAERLALDPASVQFMGVDFGHRQVHVAVADASREVLVSGGRSALTWRFASSTGSVLSPGCGPSRDARDEHG